MASTCSQILNGIRERIEAIAIPDADRFDAFDVFQGSIGPLTGEITDRTFVLQPAIPQRSQRFTTTPQCHTVDCVLMVGYRLTQDAWGRAADDGSLITETLWSTVSGADAIQDLQMIEIGHGQIRVNGEMLVAERQLTLEWLRA